MYNTDVVHGIVPIMTSLAKKLLYDFVTDKVIVHTTRKRRSS